MLGNGIVQTKKQQSVTLPGLRVSSKEAKT
jgi:hypothetical protein